MTSSLLNYTVRTLMLFVLSVGIAMSSGTSAIAGSRYVFIGTWTYQDVEDNLNDVIVHSETYVLDTSTGDLQFCIARVNEIGDAKDNIKLVHTCYKFTMTTMGGVPIGTDLSESDDVGYPLRQMIERHERPTTYLSYWLVDNSTGKILFCGRNETTSLDLTMLCN